MKPSKLLAICKEEYEIINIKLTTLPIVSIISDEVPVDKITLEDGTITLFESVNTETHVYSENTYTMHYRYRGASSIALAKKPFKIELIKEDGSNKSESLFGLRNDDDWNLIPTHGDNTLIREAVVLELYNSLANFQEVTNINPQKMVFCELFINNEYRGVYEFMEPMDEKQVSLDKNSDFLYKAFSYLGNNPASSSIEVKSYPPDYEEMKYDLIDIYVENILNSDNISYAEASKLIDIDNLIDNFIIRMVLSLIDNETKNMIYVARKQPDDTFLITKEYFDFNLSLGDTWSESRTDRNTQPYDAKNVLFNKVFSNNFSENDYKLYLSKYINRYYLLRLDVLSNENIISTISKYFDLINTSGAYIRNATRWDLEIDFLFEYDRLIDFVNEHMFETDKYINELAEEFL